MEYSFRTALISDVPALKRIQQRLVSYERPFDRGIPRKGKVIYYNIKKLVRARNTYFLVAASKNNIIACAFGQVRKNAAWAVNKTYGHIGLVFVDEKFRRKGISRCMIGQLVKWFEKKKVRDIRLEVYGKNIPAVKAYREYGFRDFVIQMRYAG